MLINKKLGNNLLIFFIILYELVTLNNAEMIEINGIFIKILNL